MAYARRYKVVVLAAALMLSLLFAVSMARASTQATQELPPNLVEGVPTDVATLLRTTHTSQFDPPSPDPAGIAYVRSSHSLLIADSEVNELAHLSTGNNLFQVSLEGDLLRIMTTLPRSDEPTGVAYNAANGHFFISDDTGTRGYYEIDPGRDGTLGTVDDVVNFVSSERFGAMDPEGIAFDDRNNRLFIADGAEGLGTQSIYAVEAGANGVFDGVPPDGDDTVTSFDTLALGIRDPEGLTYNEENGHLYILSGRDRLVGETTPDGALLRYIDVSAVGGVNLAGLSYGPASANRSSRSLYIVDRGEDNAVDPEENDGILYEVAFPLNIANLSPYVDAGRDRIVNFGEEVDLEGFVADDGNPDPPGELTTGWSQVTGPGTAHFTDEAALQAAVSFSTSGVYILRLTADDGEHSAWDEVTVTVRPPGMLYFPVIFHLPPEDF